MSRFSIDDRVFVPSRVLPRPELQPYALTEVRVVDQDDRSILIDRLDGNGSNIRVGSRLVHSKHLGILIIEIGDLQTEESTLDPLSKSVLQYLRLLVEGPLLRRFKVRTTSELSRIWKDQEQITSHVVLIGHGASDSIRFLDKPDPLSGEELGALFENAAPTSASKYFVSLSCLTGRQAFSKSFSKTKVCRDLLAPFQSVHSAVASLYAQSFFAHHLLNGESIVPAHRKAKEAVGSGVSFRHWRNGTLQQNGA